MEPVKAASVGRRGFVAAVLALPLTWRGDLSTCPMVHRPRAAGPHPTPRKGITGARVAARDKLPSPSLIALFDGVRQIPGVVDGIRCNCGCADIEGFYSLLSCYEGNAMAMSCPICQGQGRLVVRLHKEGQTLEQIRLAVDAQFG